MRDRTAMSATVDSVGIATRLRALLGTNDLDATARRLSISGGELQRSVDDRAPHPTLEVLAAVVREYGVDPSWLIHGEYNSATHYAALEEGDVTPVTLLAIAAPPERATPVDVYELRRELTNGDETPTTRRLDI